MPRQVRIEYPGAFYHVMARGNRREPIVFDERDRKTFLRTLAEACERSGFRIHAFVLMSNHYHLLLETPEANLSQGMGWFQNAYTRRINTRHRLWGHLFGDRYKAIVVEEGQWFWEVLDYIHLNPARAGLVSKETGLESNAWSSLPGYLAEPRNRPAFLETAMGFSVCGCGDDAKGRRGFLEMLESRVDWSDPRGVGKTGGGEEDGTEVAARVAMRRGWFFGSQEFREKLTKLVGGRIDARVAKRADGYHGPEVREHGERMAEGIVAAGLEVLGIGLEELRAEAKGDWRKGLVAEIVQARTTVRLDWIGERLGMGTRAGICRAVKAARERLGRDEEFAGLREQILKKINN